MCVRNSHCVRIQIRPAQLADAARLSQLAASTFRETFERDNDPADLARYLADAFSPARQAAEIADPTGIVLLAHHHSESDAPELIGYAHMVSGSPPDAIQGPDPLELKRLYVARSWHGQGVAQHLMDAVIAAASARGAQ